MSAGKVFSLRWPLTRLAAVDAAVKAAGSNRSQWVGDVVDVQLMSGAVDTDVDPLAALTAVAPRVAAWLETCSPEDRALAKGSLELMAKAYSARAAGKAPR